MTRKIIRIDVLQKKSNTKTFEAVSEVSRKKNKNKNPFSRSAVSEALCSRVYVVLSEISPHTKREQAVQSLQCTYSSTSNNTYTCCVI